MGATQVERPVGRDDAGAIQDAGRDRRHLAGDRRDHRLVEPAATVLVVTVLDQRLALAQEAQRREFGVGKAQADGVDLGTHRVRGQRVARVERVVGTDDPQVAALDAIEAVLVEEPLRACQPAVALGPLAREHQGRAEPEPAAGRPLDVATVDVLVEGPRPGGPSIEVPAGQVGRRGEPLEVLGFERGLGVRGRQARDRLPPGHRHESLATQLQGVPSRSTSHRLRVLQPSMDRNRHVSNRMSRTRFRQPPAVARHLPR